MTPITLKEVAVASSLCISALRASGTAFPPYSDGIFFCKKEVYSFLVIQYDGNIHQYNVEPQALPLYKP